jgi:hypothetical protein
LRRWGFTPQKPARRAREQNPGASPAMYIKGIFYKAPKQPYQGNNQSDKCNGYFGFYAWLPMLLFWLWVFYDYCPLKRNHHSTD